MLNFRNQYFPVMGRPPRLPDKYLARLARHLPCMLDHHIFSCVCKRWRSTAERHPGPQLPWLLMPSAAGATTFFCVAGGDTHRRPVLPEFALSAHLCGSFPSGWLVAVLPNPKGGPALLNVFTGARVPIANFLLLHLDYGRDSRCAMVIHAVALSSAPSSSRQYYAAAIVSSQSNIAFWRKGMSHWAPPARKMAPDPNADPKRPVMPNDTIEDVIYYGGGGRGCAGFYVLTTKEEFWVYAPEVGDDDDALTMFVFKYVFDGHRVTTLVAGQVVARYLVESRGELMMVVRFVSPEQDGTVAFDVLELERRQIIDEDSASASWNRLDFGTLSDRRMFLGRGCSMAVDVEDTCPLGIYFLDDAAAFHGRQTYGDAGRCWYDFKQEIVRCLPRAPPSDCSPRIWIFLSK